MLEMQAGMNAHINPGWIDAGYPFLRAVVIEGAESIEHAAWKWWKFQEANLPQVRLEIVDIVHFLLSAILVDMHGDLKAAGEWLEKRISAAELPDQRSVWIFEKEFRLDGLDLIEKLELLIGISAFRKISIPLIAAIMEDCQMSWSDLYRQYVGKNILNFFRQNNGYKANGAYRKIWSDGREDNEHLVDVLDSLNPEEHGYKEKLYEALSVRYATTNEVR